MEAFRNSLLVQSDRCLIGNRPASLASEIVGEVPFPYQLFQSYECSFEASRPRDLLLVQQCF